MSFNQFFIAVEWRLSTRWFHPVLFILLCSCSTLSKFSFHTKFTIIEKFAFLYCCLGTADDRETMGRGKKLKFKAQNLFWRDPKSRKDKDDGLALMAVARIESTYIHYRSNPFNEHYVSAKGRLTGSLFSLHAQAHPLHPFQRSLKSA